MSKKKIGDVTELTKYLLTEYFHGNHKPWFNALSDDSVFIAMGEAMLFGAENIKKALSVYTRHGRGKVYQEKYYHVPVTDDVAICIVETITGKVNDDQYRISNLFTFVYKLIDDEPKIVFEHSSYEYIAVGDDNTTGISLPMDIQTFKFIKHLLVNHTGREKLVVKNSNQTFYIDPNTIVYIEAHKHDCMIHCLDKTIECNTPLNIMKKQLDDAFYHIHRSYIVNIKFISAIRRYEALLISGTKIPIPAARFAEIQNDLDKLIPQILNK